MNCGTNLTLQTREVLIWDPNGRIASGPYKGYNWSDDVRQFYIDCAAAVREYDTEHILLLSDFNSGWGTAWPVTWKGYEYAADPVNKKIIYSVHANATHLDKEFSSYKNMVGEYRFKQQYMLPFRRSGDMVFSRLDDYNRNAKLR